MCFWFYKGLVKNTRPNHLCPMDSALSCFEIKNWLVTVIKLWLNKIRSGSANCQFMLFVTPVDISK